MQVNLKEFMCNSFVNHLELVLMNVPVLQSFLAVSDCIFGCAFKLYQSPSRSVFELYSANCIRAPTFVLAPFKAENMAATVTVISWDMREAYYCVNIQ